MDIDATTFFLALASVAAIIGGLRVRIWYTNIAGIMILTGIFMWLYIGTVVGGSIIAGFVAVNVVFLAVMFVLRD